MISVVENQNKFVFPLKKCSAEQKALTGQHTDVTDKSVEAASRLKSVEQGFKLTKEGFAVLEEPPFLCAKIMRIFIVSRLNSVWLLSRRDNKDASRPTNHRRWLMGKKVY